MKKELLPKNLMTKTLSQTLIEAAASQKQTDLSLKKFVTTQAVTPCLASS